MPRRCIFIQLDKSGIASLQHFMSRMAGEGNYHARKRAQAVWFSHEFHTVERIAEELQTSSRSVYQWLKLYKEKGLAGFTYPVRSRKLTAQQIDEIMSVSGWSTYMIKRRASTEGWPSRKIAKWIKDNWKINISHERIRQIVNKKLRGD
ncbi:MAG: helix-turn-helix domain-containing protein [Planctomycetes bacterium]|nr:helix-turn-helix domain-containing protein [Planctomycetota bacterium]